MTGAIHDKQAAAEEGRAETMETSPANEEVMGHSPTKPTEGTTRRQRYRLRLFPDMDKEASGICYINIAIGSVFAANAFLSTALLYLARAEAGCLKPGPCQGQVYGMHPDSLLTNIAWIGALAVAFCLPVVGSIVDYTPYRRHVGIFASVCLVALNAAQIGISDKNWWPMALVQIAAGFVFFVLRVVSLAYVPELSENVDKQNEYNSIFSGVLFASMVVCMVIIIGLSTLPGVNYVGTARIGQIVLVSVSTLALTYSWWRKMENRSPVDTVPEGSSIAKAGFVKIYRTSLKICSDYKAIMWFFVSAMFTGAGQTGFASTVMTIALSLLRMNSTKVGALTVTIVLFGVPGSALSHFVTKRMDPLRSLMGSLALLIVATAVASAVLTSPDRQNLAYLFGALWGCGIGWSVAAEQTFFATVLPSGAQAELYGTWYFFSTVLSWVPPLVFSILNEKKVSMQWGLATIAFFFVFALLFLFPIGGYQKAIDQVTETAETDSEEDNVVPVASISASVGVSRRSSTGRRRSSIALSRPDSDTLMLYVSDSMKI